MIRFGSQWVTLLNKSLKVLYLIVSTASRPKETRRSVLTPRKSGSRIPWTSWTARPKLCSLEPSQLDWETVRAWGQPYLFSLNLPQVQNDIILLQCTKSGTWVNNVQHNIIYIIFNYVLSYWCLPLSAINPNECKMQNLVMFPFLWAQLSSWPEVIAFSVVKFSCGSSKWNTPVFLTDMGFCKCCWWN